MLDLNEAPSRIRELGAYWAGLAGGAAPERSALDVTELKPLLPYLMLVEFEADPFVVRYRLTGTKIDEWVGFSATGRTVNEFLATDRTGSTRYLLECYQRCWRSGEPEVGAYDWPSVSGSPLRIWFGMFPLRVGGVIGQCLVVEDFGNLPQNAEPLPWLDPAAG